MHYFLIDVSRVKINTAETEQPLPLICARVNEGDLQPTMLTGTQDRPVTVLPPIVK